MLFCQAVVTSSDELGWECVYSQSSPLSCTYAELSQQKLWFSLSAVECFCDLWNEILLLSINIFWASEKCLYFAKHETSCFLSFLNYYIFLLPVFHRFLKQTGVLHLKWIPMLMTVLSVPINMYIETPQFMNVSMASQPSDLFNHNHSHYLYQQWKKGDHFQF